MTFAPEVVRANRTAASQAPPGRAIRLAWSLANPRPEARDHAPRHPTRGGLAGVLKQWQTQENCDMTNSIDVRPVAHSSR